VKEGKKWLEWRYQNPRWISWTDTTNG
jgi:hypothetical protein